MSNIYNSIQNLYNMDKTTWQEVLAEVYNKQIEIEGQYEQVMNNLKNYILTASNGEQYILKVNNDGSLTTEKI